MKTLLIKKLIVALAATVLCVTILKAQIPNARSKIMDYKFKNTLLHRMQENQNLAGSTQKFKIKINPYWEHVNSPQPQNTYEVQVKVPCSNAVWAKVGDTTGFDTKHFLRTADGGRTWRYDTIPSPFGYVIASIAPVDGNICYAAMYNQAVGFGGGIFKTTDGGATWKQLATGKIFNSTSFPDFVYFFDVKHGLAVGDGNGPGTPYMEIYTTDDAGATWVRVPRENIPAVAAGTPYGLIANYTVFENRIWFRGYDSAFNNYTYRSDDLGHHWELFTSSSFYPALAFTDKLNGIASGYDSTGNLLISASHNGGKTFEPINYTGVAGVGFGFFKAIPFTHTIISSFNCCSAVGGGTSYSNDNGVTWHLIDSNVEHTDVDFLNPFVGWTGKIYDPTNPTDSTGGMFKWKLHFSLDNNAIAANDANASSDNAIAVTKNNTTSLLVYPNPVSNSATVSFNLQQTQKVAVTIYDMNGKLIRTLADAQMLPGTHQLTWNARSENVIAGTYLIKLQAGAFIETKKISVVR
ncbi:MAG TPA: T9SS type A sorting domain-containing protein [Parafilimonas sp.]|nr:T9SS type A sorting domain-containing protein [Parafilimonas sp.]